MRKSEVVTRRGIPECCVKVYAGFPLKSLPDPGMDARFTEAAFDALPYDAKEAAWNLACECAWEDLQAAAEDIFGDRAKVYSEGRSGGWASVHGLPPVESWDAIDVSRWARFCRACADAVTGVPYNALWGLCMNVWLPAQETRDAIRAAQSDAAAQGV